MSHSEDKKELAGLARSVEALFGPRPDTAEMTSDEVDSTPVSEDPESTHDADAAPDAHSSASVSGGPAAGDDDFGGGFDAADLDFAFEPDPAFPSAGDARPVPESPVDPVPEPTPDTAVETDADEGLGWGAAIESVVNLDEDFAFEPDPAFPAEAEAHFAGPPAGARAHFAAPPVAAGEGEEVDLGLPPDDGSGENVPTPIDLAVDEVLAGNASRASEVQRLSAELVERKEIDPIARSVARLVHAAGTPQDPTLYGLAEALMSPVVLGRLARKIGTERDEARRHAYFAVCTSIGRDMAEALRTELADSTDRLSRRIHYDALVAMAEVSRPVIEEMIHDDNRFLVRNAVAILGDTGGDNAVELVTSALANPDARVRREALLSLAKLGDEEAGQLIVGFFEDPDLEVRKAAVVAAGELRVERALRPLIALLDEAHEADDVIPLLRALGRIGDPGAVASIERHAVRPLFSKPRTEIRIAAHRALAAMGTPQARRLLQQALGDKDPEVKAAVKQALHMR